MKAKEIQAAIREKGTTQKTIASDLGVTEMSISKAVNKQFISDRIFKAIAEAIGRKKEAVFPDYYYGPKLRKTSKAFGPKTNQ